MLFHFLNFSQCVLCMFGYKTIYKVTNSKIYSKGRYFVFILFKNYTANGSFGLQSSFPLICDITNSKSGLLKSDWLAGGECLVELCKSAKFANAVFFPCNHSEIANISTLMGPTLWVFKALQEMLICISATPKHLKASKTNLITRFTPNIW